MRKSRKKFDIVHFSKYCSPSAGGIERVSHILTENFQSMDWRIASVCFQDDMVPEEGGDRKNFYSCKVNFKIMSQPISWQYLLKCIELGRQSSILHIHLPNYLAIIGSLALLGKVKIVVHWHSDVIRRATLEGLLSPIVNIFLMLADCIIATSPQYVQYSKYLKKFSHKVVVVPIGIKPLIPSKMKRDDCDSEFIVLAVGRLVSYKGFELLIKASQHLPAFCKIVIVGDGPERKFLESLVVELAVKERVILKGRLSDTELDRVYSGAKLFCLPSINRAEAFGVVLLEAMRRGMPLVTFDVPGSGITFVNQHMESGLVAQKIDEKSLADCINQLILDKELYDSLSKGSVQRFMKYFTEEAMINSIKKIYYELK